MFFNTHAMNDNLIKYYQDRAAEYDKIYAKRERQHDLQQAATLLQALFKAKDVLEIACGTGYWTERIAHTARSITATDINEAVLDIARHKTYNHTALNFVQADIYKLDTGKKYESLFGGFIWSHIPLQELGRFIETVNAQVKDAGLVVMMDNIYVEGSNHPIAHTDEYGNTFQDRKLGDGSVHRVLKNFPSADFLKGKLHALQRMYRLSSCLIIGYSFIHFK